MKRSRPDDDASPPPPLPHGVCVRVKHLRPRGYTDLRAWRTADGKRHVLLTRNGRVFIDGQIYHYPRSEWANAYKVGAKHYTLDDSLRRYERDLRQRLADDAACRARFVQLCHADELGCFCEPGARCHRDVVLRVLAEQLAAERHGDGDGLQ